MGSGTCRGEITLMRLHFIYIAKSDIGNFVSCAEMEFYR